MPAKDVVYLLTGENTHSADRAMENERGLKLSALISDLQDILSSCGDAPVIMQGYGAGAIFEPVTEAEFVFGRGDEDND